MAPDIGGPSRVSAVGDHEGRKEGCVSRNADVDREAPSASGYEAAPGRSTSEQSGYLPRDLAALRADLVFARLRTIARACFCADTQRQGSRRRDPDAAHVASLCDCP